MPRSERAPTAERFFWAFPLVLLTAIVCGFLVVRDGPGWLGPAAIALLVGAVLLWVGVSVFWPAKADRRCPTCGEEALERLDPETTQGVRCRACDHVDEEATGWFLAEDEGPLEDLVLRQRARKRGRTRGTTRGTTRGPAPGRARGRKLPRDRAGA